MVFEDNFLILTVTVSYCAKKSWIFLLFFSVSYNNMVVTKQIYFWPTFLKSWVHISDDIAGVVGGLQYY